MKIGRWRRQMPITVPSLRLTRRKLSAADVQLLCSEIASVGARRAPQHAELISVKLVRFV